MREWTFYYYSIFNDSVIISFDNNYKFIIDEIEKRNTLNFFLNCLKHKPLKKWKYFINFDWISLKFNHNLNYQIKKFYALRKIEIFTIIKLIRLI